MNNRIKSFGLVAFYIAAIFLAGCIPEDSLEWSDDGSIGVLCYDGMLALVDGKTGELTKINIPESEDPFNNICISKDGKLIAYSIGEECSSLKEGLKQLPENQVTLIENCAQYVREQILQGQTDLEEMDLGPFHGEHC